MKCAFSEHSLKHSPIASKFKRHVLPAVRRGRPHVACAASLRKPTQLTSYALHLYANLAWMSQRPAHQLDDELWQSIICQLTLVDALNFSRTCKRFWSVAQEDAVWHCLYCSEFGACLPLQQNKRWKTIFKSRCVSTLTELGFLKYRPNSREAIH